MRADAARNRARVLEIAYETFAAEGLAVPIDEIARRAGVGAGTVYRHFPTKEALFEAVIADRVRGVVARADELLAQDPASALFEFLREMVRNAEVDHGMVDALAGYGVDVDAAAPGAEAEFLQAMGELVTAGQHAGTVRADVGPAEAMALLMVCKSTQGQGGVIPERVVGVVIDGLRAGI